jgi:hypothetical protein
MVRKEALETGIGRDDISAIGFEGLSSRLACLTCIGMDKSDYFLCLLRMDLGISLPSRPYAIDSAESTS